MPNERPPTLDPAALTASLKGSKRAYKAEFMQHLAFVQGCLAQGHTLRNIYDYLQASDAALTFSYETFRRYARKHAPEPHTAQPPATPRTPSASPPTTTTQAPAQPTPPRPTPSPSPPSPIGILDRLTRRAPRPTD